jgi:hypothetical protein
LKTITLEFHPESGRDKKDWIYLSSIDDVFKNGAFPRLEEVSFDFWINQALSMKFCEEVATQLPYLRQQKLLRFIYSSRCPFFVYN